MSTAARTAPVALPPRTRARERLLLAIFAGGALGAVGRVALERFFPASGSGWPWATFAANVLGAALLGYAVTRLQERLPPSTYPRPFLGTGLCGALTTFSTLQLEAVELVRGGHALLGVSYLGASIAAGLVALHVASALVRRAWFR